jgi:hypothetical protein
MLPSLAPGSCSCSRRHEQRIRHGWRCRLHRRKVLPVRLRARQGDGSVAAKLEICVSGVDGEDFRASSSNGQNANWLDRTVVLSARMVSQRSPSQTNRIALMEPALSRLSTRSERLCLSVRRYCLVMRRWLSQLISPTSGRSPFLVSATGTRRPHSKPPSLQTDVETY